MEAAWNTMEKKEKIMWIKKAAEDQKRYEVSKAWLKVIICLTYVFSTLHTIKGYDD